MDTQLITLEEDIRNANLIKESVISRLYKDGMLNDEQASTYIEKWQVVIIKPTWFKRWMEKFTPTNTNSYRYKYVKFED
jgi:hypothetical protein